MRWTQQQRIRLCNIFSLDFSALYCYAFLHMSEGKNVFPTHTMKCLEGSRGKAPIILIYEGEWLTSLENSSPHRVPFVNETSAA